MKSKVDNILLIIITLFIFSFVTRKVYADENINYEQKIYWEIDSNTNDYEQHGSHVAGIVGAVGNMVGISGVARNVSLVSLNQ